MPRSKSSLSIPSRRAAILFTFVLALLPALASAGSFRVWGTDDTEKLREVPPVTGRYPDSTHVWYASPAETSITLHGARNEWIACQLAIHGTSAGGISASGLYVTAGDLAFQGHRIPSDSIRLYFEHDMIITSQNAYGRGKGAPGDGAYRDALIPFRDPYSSVPRAVVPPFSVGTGKNHMIWVDIHIPRNAPAGLYVGPLTVTVSDSTALPKTVDLKVNVWNFTIPDTTGLPMLVGLHPDFLAAAEQLQTLPSYFNTDFFDMLKKYELMASDHRFSLALKNMIPDVNKDTTTGEIYSIDWADYDAYMSQIIDGSMFPDHRPPPLWLLPIAQRYRVPFGSVVDSLLVSRYVDSVAVHYQQNGWPLDKSFAWIYDEPRNYQDINFPSEIIAYARAIRAGSPLVNFMLTDGIEDSVFVRPQSVDWWCSRAFKYYPPEMNGLAASDSVRKRMMYQTYLEPALTSESIDTKGLGFRLWPWVAFKYGVDAILYWAGDYWYVTDPYDVADGQPDSYDDGEGTFFYPGHMLHSVSRPNYPTFQDIDGPVSSYRMKSLRRGLEDYAYLERLESKGQVLFDSTRVRVLVQSALCATHSDSFVPQWGNTHYCPSNADPRFQADTSKWAQSPMTWYDQRVIMGTKLSQIGEDTLTAWVLSPNGGEAWAAGSPQTITWETSGDSGPDSVDIFLSTDGGATLADTLARRLPNNGSFNWTANGAVADSFWCVLRVSGGGQFASAVSDGPFRITDGVPPTAHLVKPNGGELWVKRRPDTIRWVASDNNAVAGVDLRLSTDGGSTYPVVIATMIPNDSVYVWSVPDSVLPSHFARVEVIAHDASGATGSDASDTTFVIADTLAVHVTAPNGGEVWPVGTPENITWTSSGGSGTGSASIFLSHDGGATLSDTLVQGAPNTGVWSWPVTGTGGDTLWCAVRVTDVTGSAQDVSDAPFTLSGGSLPSIRVLAPNGGELWQKTTAETIRWATSVDSLAHVAMRLRMSHPPGSRPALTTPPPDSIMGIDLRLSTNGGASYPILIAGGLPNNGFYVWSVPDSVVVSSTALVKATVHTLYGLQASDVSDNLFGIDVRFTVHVTSPNGGERWNVGTGHTVTWSTTGGGDSIKIDLFMARSAGGAPAETLALGRANDGAFTWNVRQTPGDTLWSVVRAFARGEYVSDTGDSSFACVDTIPPLVKVLSPNGGERWRIASTDTIHWTATDNDTVTSVDLFLTMNGGRSYTPLASGIANSGQIRWIIPGWFSPTDSARIRVRARDRVGLLTTDDTDGLFSITPPAQDLALQIGVLQNPLLTRHLDIYAVANKAILDTSLTVTVGGSPVAMTSSDSLNYVYRGSYVVGASGSLPLEACARDYAQQPACTNTSMDIALIRALDGGVAADPKGEMSLRVLAGSVREDLYLLLTRGSPPRTGGGAAWDGANLVTLYGVGPDGASLAEPGDLRVKVGPPGPQDLRIGLARYDGGAWHALTTWADTRTGERVAGVDRLGQFAVVSSEGAPLSQELPTSLVVKGARPNPFNPRTAIQYVLPDRGPVRLKIYDATGRLTRTLVADEQGPGDHAVTWDGRDDRGREVASGMYLYRLEAAGSTHMQKLVLLK